MNAAGNLGVALEKISNEMFAFQGWMNWLILLEPGRDRLP